MPYGAARVYLRWRDAHAYGDGWVDPETMDPAACYGESVAWLLPGATPGHITITHSITEAGAYQPFRIPIAMVDRITYLVEGVSIPIWPDDEEPQA